ncbi:N-acetylmuramoyl-L-alanine amidase [Schaalia sp. ZJ405]|uniref:N-acetylmuramoyl-L-alanine amidase n=1 Tax=Schaalia sp. ZJ405 TaxID=2709403 RepID=UPI0013ED6AB3|nr:N-acetylmuramoyl-L-alanine amidase [Schaalia sp. ZJ405]QPK80827.1 N-acetylmuramoyl-L-alanine amidase [Schaalia sp. ZJ405]
MYAYETGMNSPAYTHGRPGVGKPQFIVLHHWGALGQLFANVLAFLCRPGADTSAHYVVEKGKVACIVDPDDTAWHAGNWDANLRGIGIECRPEMDKADFETVAELIAELRHAYGPLPLRIHKEFFATACPGRWEAQRSALDARANALMKGAKTAAAASVSKPAASKGPNYEALADAVIRGEYGSGEERMRRLGNAYARVQAIVNARLLGGQPTPTPLPAKPAGANIDALAKAVIRGEYGTGDARRQKLGNLYDQVQARVNQILGAGATAHRAGANIDALADAVIRGEYGNGDERRVRLGANFAAVQARVNQKLAA